MNAQIGDFGATDSTLKLFRPIVLQPLVLSDFVQRVQIDAAVGTAKVLFQIVDMVAEMSLQPVRVRGPIGIEPILLA